LRANLVETELAIVHHRPSDEEYTLSDVEGLRSDTVNNAADTGRSTNEDSVYGQWKTWVQSKARRHAQSPHRPYTRTCSRPVQHNQSNEDA